MNPPSSFQNANVLSLILPKSEVVYAHKGDSVRQVLEQMSHHRYEQIPVLDEMGHYVDSVAEGDLLFYLAENQLDYNLLHHIPLKDVPRHRKVAALPVSTPFEAMLPLVADQNYVPPVDDSGIFIGIVTRKAILFALMGKDARI